MKKKTKISLAISLVVALATIVATYNGNLPQQSQINIKRKDSSNISSNTMQGTTGNKSPIINNASGDVNINYD